MSSVDRIGGSGKAPLAAANPRKNSRKLFGVVVSIAMEGNRFRTSARSASSCARIGSPPPKVNGRVHVIRNPYLQIPVQSIEKLHQFPFPSNRRRSKLGAVWP